MLAPVIPGQPPCVLAFQLQPCRWSLEGSRASSATGSHRSKGLAALPGCQNKLWIKELVSEAALKETLQETGPSGQPRGTSHMHARTGSTGFLRNSRSWGWSDQDLGPRCCPSPRSHALLRVALKHGSSPAEKRGDLHFQSYSSRSESCKQTQKRCTSTNSSKAKAFERAQRSR